jgi:hypothetical protein
MTRKPQLWRARRKGSQVWMYFRYWPGSAFCPSAAASRIAGRQREQQTLDAEPERLIRAGKVRIAHTDVDYYIEGRL